MEFFLNQNNNYIIDLFSKYHLILILLTFLFSVLIILNKEKFKQMNETRKKRIRIVFALILIVNLIIRRGSFIYYGVYNWHYHLDINFCNFTSILFIIYGLSGNKKLYRICYYMAFIGPLLSVIAPSANMKPLNYSFYSFLLIHHFVFIFNIIFMYMEDLKYHKKDFLKVIIFLLIYFTLIYAFNYFMGTEYNMPLTFFNNIFLNNSFIKELSYNNFVVFAIFIFINILMLSIGKYSLKYLNK